MEDLDEDWLFANFRTTRQWIIDTLIRMNDDDIRKILPELCRLLGRPDLANIS
jgi:hypothetical protein